MSTIPLVIAVIALIIGAIEALRSFGVINGGRSLLAFGFFLLALAVVWDPVAHLIGK